MVESAGYGNRGLRPDPAMTMHRMIMFGLAAVFAGTVASRSQAAPLDPSTVCASFYQAQATKFAVANNAPVPFQWIRHSISKTTVVLDLEVFWTGGAKIYSGFLCNILSNGSVVAAQSTQSN
jgi:hypothetical protein